jgi:hypothetical protein
MLSGKAIALIVAAIVLVVVVLLAHTWWVNSRSATLTDLQTAATLKNWGLNLTVGRIAGQADPTGWVGKPIEIHISSAGKTLKSTVAAAGLDQFGRTVVTTGPGVVKVNQFLKVSPDDWARIEVKN